MNKEVHIQMHLRVVYFKICNKIPMFIFHVKNHSRSKVSLYKDLHIYMPHQHILKLAIFETMLSFSVNSSYFLLYTFYTNTS